LKAIFLLGSNLRALAMIGIVGKGGAGLTLADAFGRYDYNVTLAITIVIPGAILVSGAINERIRKMLRPSLDTTANGYSNADHFS